MLKRTILTAAEGFEEFVAQMKATKLPGNLCGRPRLVIAIGTKLIVHD